jgi:hypothetical protein
MQRVIIAGVTVCCAVSKRHTKDSAAHEKQNIMMKCGN